MSAGDKRGRGREHGLVLLRGGLDVELPEAAPRDAQAEWEGFCRRIGWDREAPTLPGDYESELFERVLGAGSTGAPVVARWTDEPSVGARTGRALRRGAAVALLLALAAAAVWALRVRSDAPPVASPEASPEIAPWIPRSSTPSFDAAPVDDRTPEESTPAPGPSAPPAPTEPRSGALVAVRRVQPSVRTRPASRVREADATAHPAGEPSSPVAKSVENAAPSLADDEAAPEEGAALVGVLAQSPLGAAPLATGPRIDTPPPIEHVDVARERARPSWSLAPSASRWVGFSATPASPSTDLGTRSGLGVMAQVDFGVALEHL